MDTDILHQYIDSADYLESSGHLDGSIEALESLSDILEDILQDLHYRNLEND